MPCWMSQFRAELPRDAASWEVAPLLGDLNHAKVLIFLHQPLLGPGLPLEVGQQQLLLRAYMEATHGAFVCPSHLELNFAVVQILVGARVVFLNVFDDVVNQQKGNLFLHKDKGRKAQ